jgi:hypothetical protein
LSDTAMKYGAGPKPNLGLSFDLREDFNAKAQM